MFVLVALLGATSPVWLLSRGDAMHVICQVQWTVNDGIHTVSTKISSPTKVPAQQPPPPPFCIYKCSKFKLELLFWKEKVTQPSCVGLNMLEREENKVYLLMNIQNHGCWHDAQEIRLGWLCERVYWPTAFCSSPSLNWTVIMVMNRCFVCGTDIKFVPAT